MLGIPSPAILELRHYLEAQAAASHAKFVIFNGHIHNYERLKRAPLSHLYPRRSRPLRSKVSTPT
jgi:hypothetical protein